MPKRHRSTAPTSRSGASNALTNARPALATSGCRFTTTGCGRRGKGGGKGAEGRSTVRETWRSGVDRSSTALCVTGGTVRGLHPSERDTVSRFRHAIDSLRGEGAEAGGGEGGEAGGGDVGGGEAGGGDAGGGDAGGGESGGRGGGARPHPDRSVRGFRLMEGAGLEAALVEALTLAREGGSAAPLLVLERAAW